MPKASVTLAVPVKRTIDAPRTLVLSSARQDFNDDCSTRDTRWRERERERKERERERESERERVREREFSRFVAAELTGRVVSSSHTSFRAGSVFTFPFILLSSTNLSQRFSNFRISRRMDCTTLAKILSFLALIQYVMCEIAPDPKTFFPAIEGNLTKIVWAHAVNSQANLTKALNADDIMMLEGDVMIGNLTNSNNTNIPIMAHPPDLESDLSLDEFLSSVLNSTKGVKLDFKSLEAFERSKPILAENRKKFTKPLFLNADILPGPVEAKTVPLDSKSFLTGAMEAFPESVLSIGWTTRYGSEFNITEGHYTTEQIQKMIDTLTENKVTQSITYPVRAGLAANDISAMKTLMDRSSSFGNVTMTIWSSHGDQVDTKKLSELIKTIGVGKVYVDVPEDVWKNLDLTSGSSTSNVAMMTAMTLLSFLFARML